MPSMTMIAGAEIAGLVEANRAALLDVVRGGYLCHHAGNSSLPHSSFLRFPGRPRDRIIALPAYLGGEFGVSGIKWIASYPGNVEHGLPRASAVLLLNSTETGFPYACIEASVISATRTAASAVLAAELLAGGRTAARVGFVGTGLIAGHVRRFLRDLGWTVGGYRLFDVSRSAAERFAAALDRDGAVDVVVVDKDAAAFEGCDLVVIATVAAEPHLSDPAILDHAPAVLHLSLRDLAPELVLAAQNITDDVDHALREGTSLHLAEQRVGNRDFVHGTIADLLEGRLHRDRERAAIFAPFGLGVLDLAVGKWVYDQVVAAGGGSQIPDFFAPASSS